MARSTRTARLVIAVSAALLIAYAVIWSQVSTVEIGRSDFTSAYVGGTLLREGHGASLYDEALQRPLHSRLIAPDREGNLPFADAPLAAAVIAPATLLDLDPAYRVWGVLELGILVFAVVIAIRAAPWPEGHSGLWKAATGFAAIAGVATLLMLTQAQWAPVLALGVAVAYACWRSNRLAAGGAVLVVSAAIVKPHLALGLLAFMLGWRERRVLAGALAAAVAAGLASLVVAGPGGVAGFVAALTSSVTRWQTGAMPSPGGVVEALVGTDPVGVALLAAASLAACAGACWLGIRVRRNRLLLEPALAGAVVLSLLAAPHLWAFDLAMLAPAFVIAVAWAMTNRVSVYRNSPIPLLCIAASWLVINIGTTVAAGADAGAASGVPAAAALLSAAALAVAAVRIGYRPAHEAAVGSVADGVRGSREGEQLRVLSV